MRVFDFDNTIYDGESIFDVFLYFLKKDFKNIIRYAPKFIKDFIRYKFDKITVDEAMASYGAAFKEYCQKYDNIYDEFEKFWDMNQNKLKNFGENTLTLTKEFFKSFTPYQIIYLSSVIVLVALFAILTLASTVTVSLTRNAPLYWFIVFSTVVIPPRLKVP